MPKSRARKKAKTKNELERIERKRREKLVREAHGRVDDLQKRYRVLEEYERDVLGVKKEVKDVDGGRESSDSSKSGSENATEYGD